jgi:hypothetical protein
MYLNLSLKVAFNDVKIVFLCANVLKNELFVPYIRFFHSNLKIPILQFLIIACDRIVQPKKICVKINNIAKTLPRKGGSHDISQRLEKLGYSGRKKIQKDHLLNLISGKYYA